MNIYFAPANYCLCQLCGLGKRKNILRNFLEGLFSIHGFTAEFEGCSCKEVQSLPPRTLDCKTKPERLFVLLAALLSLGCPKLACGRDQKN